LTKNSHNGENDRRARNGRISLFQGETNSLQGMRTLLRRDKLLSLSHRTTRCNVSEEIKTKLRNATPL